MEYTFNDIWQLLNPQGEYVRRVNACGKIWNELSFFRRKHIYDTISCLKAQGKYVNPNPLFAIKDVPEPQPVFLSGKEQDDCKKRGIPLVQVKYGDSFLICTAQTQQEFNLLKTRDW